MKRYIMTFLSVFIVSAFSLYIYENDNRPFFMTFDTVTPLANEVQNNAFSPIIIQPDKDGHFRINALMNGQNVNMLLDTGASMVALSKDDAKRLGYSYTDKDFTQQGSTASGKVKFIEVKIRNIKIGNMVFKDVPAAIIDQPNVPALLGMSFISAFKKVEITENKLFITP